MGDELKRVDGRKVSVLQATPVNHHLVHRKQASQRLQLLLLRPLNLAEDVRLRLFSWHSEPQPRVTSPTHLAQEHDFALSRPQLHL